jgi:tetratricopeptide (TPR) repeat protein
MQELHRGSSEETLAGNHEEALRYVEEAARRQPGHPGVLLTLLKCHDRLRNQDKVDELTRGIWRIVAHEPALVDQLGDELQTIRQYDLALETFALLSQAAAPQARAVGKSREAALHLRVGRTAEAAAALAEAESLGAGLPEVRSAKALLCRRSDPALARELLEPLSWPDPAIPAPFTAASAHSLAAACDSLGLPDEAMAALARGKAIEAADPLATRFRRQRPEWRRWHAEAMDFSREDAERWAAESRDEGFPEHAFLLGHPRSGTTLLEQILDAHPSICSVEESEPYSTAIDAVLIRRHEREGAGIPFSDWMRSLPAGTMKKLRADYFAQLAREAGRAFEGLRVIDKNPGLTASVGRIPLTMPGSGLIVMIRDPRDVCLSSYFQSTHRTPWSVNWLTIEETVEQYAFVMNLWLQARNKVVQPWIEIRYEDLVDDPEKEGRRVTRFLGLSWNDAQSDPAAHARSKIVRSPTHSDVVQPVYRRAIGRWRAYAKHLAPFQSTLEPFLEAFGYSDCG